MKRRHIPSHVAARLKRVGLGLAGLAFLALLRPVLVSAQGSLSIPWFTIDGGGGSSSAAGFSISGTIGQSDAASSSGGGYSLDGGYWSGQVSDMIHDIYLPLVVR